MMSDKSVGTGGPAWCSHGKAGLCEVIETELMLEKKIPADGPAVDEIEMRLHRIAGNSVRSRREKYACHEGR